MGPRPAWLVRFCEADGTRPKRSERLDSALQAGGRPFDPGTLHRRTRRHDHGRRPASDHHPGVPAWSASSGWRRHRLDVQTAASDQPRDQRIRVPHLTGTPTAGPRGRGPSRSRPAMGVSLRRHPGSCRLCQQPPPAHIPPTGGFAAAVDSSGSQPTQRPRRAAPRHVGAAAMQFSSARKVLS